MHFVCLLFPQSSSLSGGVDHTQRCQDQLLLYGKAASLLLLQEPLSASAEELLLSCVAEAEAVRCQLQPELLQVRGDRSHCCSGACHGVFGCSSSRGRAPAQKSCSSLRPFRW